MATRGRAGGLSGGGWQGASRLSEVALLQQLERERREARGGNDAE